VLSGFRWLVFCTEKISRDYWVDFAVLWGFFEGGFGKCACFLWCFDGEIVVKCDIIVDDTCS